MAGSTLAICCALNQGGWDNPANINAQGHDSSFSDAFFGWNYVASDNDPLDDNNHGSHTAGTIGAIGNNGVGLAGVNWSVQIMALKFLDSGGSGSDTNGAAAIRFAADNGAVVANASWGDTAFSYDLYQALSYANSKGMIFAAAAGNSGQNADTSPLYPAAFTVTRSGTDDSGKPVTVPGLPNVISVAATDINGNLASFSNYGPMSVTLAAPGVNVYSTVAGGGYAFFSGTSMATPHVAGTLALMKAEYPNMNYLQMIAKLENATTFDSVLVGKTVTYGLLNAAGAVATGPEIQLQDGSTFVPHNGGSEDFGTAQTNSISQTFTITNVGTQIMTIGTITAPTGFSVTQPAATSLAAGATTTFVVTLSNQIAPGNYSGTVSIPTNDPNNNPFQFNVSGTVGAPTVQTIDDMRHVRVHDHRGVGLVSNWLQRRDEVCRRGDRI